MINAIPDRDPEKLQGISGGRCSTAPCCPLRHRGSLAEYRTGHVPGAVCIPLGELAARLGELVPELDVIAYCRGAYCVFSHDAVRLLRSAGRRAVRLEDAVFEWRLAAYPVAA